MHASAKFKGCAKKNPSGVLLIKQLRKGSWCSSSSSFVKIMLRMELWYGRSIEEDKCIIGISPPDSWDDGSRLEHCVSIPFNEDFG